MVTMASAVKGGLAAGLLLVGLLLLGGLSSPAQAPVVTFWTTEIGPEQVGIQIELAEEFAAATGIEVEIIPVKEDELPERVLAAFAAGTLPDLVLVPLEFVAGWAEAGILDVRAATATIRELGADTFFTSSLKLAAVRGGWAAVPADGWGLLLLYRRDLFEERGLSPPTTWDMILKAADALNEPPLLWGFEVATDPSSVYTQQVFEHIALSNGARLVDEAGKINLVTPEFIEALDFYRLLATEFTPPGALHQEHARLDYLTGRAAMILWSPAILDELAGLRREPVPLPMEPPLYRRTWIVTAFSGPRGTPTPVQWGRVNYLGITTAAEVEPTREWVKFLLTEGYLRWLGMAPERKLPVRPEFADGWIGLMGRAKLVELYGKEAVEALLQGMERLDRWGFAAGRGTCVMSIYRSLIVPKILREFIEGEMTSYEAASLMTSVISELEGCS